MAVIYDCSIFFLFTFSDLLVNIFSVTIFATSPNFFFKLFIQETEREAETQADGEAGSMLEA